MELEKRKEIPPELAAGIALAALIEGATLGHWRTRLSNELLNKVMDRLRYSLANGDELAEAITGAFGGTVDGVPTTSAIEATRRHTHTIASTAIASAVTAARLAALQANGDIVKGIQQVSILDNRTSGTCIAYSGQAWDIETLQPIFGSTLPYNGGPPRHFNCRSTIVPILRSWEEMGAFGAALPDKLKERLTGKPPGDITFDQWLRGKSDSFQNKLLGPTRARLWRKGQITLTQLVDMRGNPLTLDQLEAKIKKRRRK